MNKKIKNTSKIILYKTTEGIPALKVKLDGETVWLSLNQMSSLFSRDKTVVSRHIGNIYKTKELAREATVAKYATVQNEGGRLVERSITFYNLDMIISVGYRVNSKRGTHFRKWASTVLKNHIIEGFAINKKRLQKKGLKKLEEALTLIKKTALSKQLNTSEAVGLLEVITTYANSWVLLQRYDEQSLDIPKKTTKVKHNLTYDEALEAILQLKIKLIKDKTAGNLFGAQRDKMLESILGTINQTFDGKDLYPSIEEKAAHLLYFVIKDHPLNDGNKRSACLLFILFLQKNNHLADKNGVLKFNSNALVALALLVAQSDPKEKETMIILIINLLN